jgi:hypothetical protein
VSAERDALLSEFIDAWNAGRRPRLEDFLERAAPADRDALADDVATFVGLADAPALDPAVVAAEPVVREVVAALDAQAGLWPAMLPRLRARARLRVDELAARLAAALGVRGAEAKTAGYLRAMEDGTLEPAGVSRRVLDALGRLLDADPAELAAAGRFAAPAAAGGALFRTDAPDPDVAERLDVLADALATPSPATWDDVDRLFRGAGG